MNQEQNDSPKKSHKFLGRKNDLLCYRTTLRYLNIFNFKNYNLFKKMFVKFSMLSKEKLIYFKINIPKMKLILYIIQQERSIVDTSENNSTEVIKSSIILNMEENKNRN